MIWSKLPNRYARIFQANLFRHIDFWDSKDTQPIFLYDQHDYHMRGISFLNFIEDPQWLAFKNNPEAKILVYFPDEFLHYKDIELVVAGIQTLDLDPARIYWLVLDENNVSYVRDSAKKYGITGMKIHGFNLLLDKVKIIDDPSTQKADYRFSSLSRNHRMWRLHLFAKLAEYGLLKDFKYSFHNLDPYGAGGTGSYFDTSTFEQDLIDHNYGPVNDTVRQWIADIPYDLGNVMDKYSDFTYQAIFQGDIHLLIESHYDPFDFDRGKRYLMTVEEMAPAFPTEKTYKAMVCKRPFIAFTTPFFLKGLRQMGYKTFGPFIDETYDMIENDKKRLSAVVLEIKRLSELSADQFEEVRQNCDDAIEHNYHLFCHRKKNLSLSYEFKFLNQYLHPLQFKIPL